MMNNILTKVALRYRALYLDIRREDINNTSATTAPVMAFVARLKENGFCVSEELLHALNAVSSDTLAEITRCIEEVMGVNLNWAALVKGWDVPTGESYVDHLITWVANIMGGENAGFYYVTLTVDTSGGATHPTVNGHIASARVLTEFIKEKGLI